MLTVIPVLQASGAVVAVLKAVVSGAAITVSDRLAVLLSTVLQATGAVVTVSKDSGAELTVTVLQASGAHCCYSITG